ncbi:glycoside hydrolase family 43 protein [Deinococcus cellulosilyticus]|uniref:Hydrolase n=1 Tax=Deinococcus cellulosilyticus (strain DSM 18568 / NBRC 106333 / KACC 11606 / 5516J-15) TaxID=1223518 RepID=A0A511N069_DEIC1|nr:glycoside hydrolase family 43 protein [Deinococcus cellulosilyticus]GEM46223.1 hydrolase [Deinococcus cellulosilyticus NBRC 106333 = KACC 11606]
MQSLKLPLMSLALCTLAACTTTPIQPAPGVTSQAQTSINNADPSVIRVGSTYYSVESDGRLIFVRAASSIQNLGSAPRVQVWGNPANLPEIWAPEIIRDPATGTYYIYFAGGAGAGHRMYYIKSNAPQSGYSGAVQMALPDNKWAIDGVAFKYKNQWYFTWSGWAGDTNGEQNIYIATMSSPTTVTGPRHIISQPREWWEKVDPNPPTRVNEGPQPIVDPSGQLHIVYSANGSWGVNYCLADLRLKLNGNVTYVWDYFKSNGCLFSSHAPMMSGWNTTLYAKGVGHHSFVLLDGDVNTSPPAGPTFPMMYHGVPMNQNPSNFWAARYWYAGSFAWWGNTTYTRGSESNTGWSLKFFE